MQDFVGFSHSKEKKMEHNNSDITIRDMENQICALVDSSSPCEESRWKVEELQPLKIWDCKNLKYEICKDCDKIVIDCEWQNREMVKGDQYRLCLSKLVEPSVIIVVANFWCHVIGPFAGIT